MSIDPDCFSDAGPAAVFAHLDAPETRGSDREAAVGEKARYLLDGKTGVASQLGGRMAQDVYARQRRSRRTQMATLIPIEQPGRDDSGTALPPLYGRIGGIESSAVPSQALIASLQAEATRGGRLCQPYLGKRRRPGHPLR